MHILSYLLDHGLAPEVATVALALILGAVFAACLNQHRVVDPANRVWACF